MAAYGLSDDDRRMVQADFARMKDLPRNLIPTERQLTPPGTTANFQRILVTDDACYGPGGLRYYPGVIQSFDRNAGTYSTMSGTGPVWLKEANNSRLDLIAYTACIQIADQVTVMCGSGSGSGSGGGTGSGSGATPDTRALFEVNAPELVTDVACVDGELTPYFTGQ